MKPFRPAAVLLDLDGTLVDSEPLQREGYRRYFASRGWPEPDLSLFTGRRAEDVLPTIDGPWRDEDPLAIAQAIGALVPRDRPPPEVPGATALIRNAHAAGIPLAIVTSAGPAWVQTAVGDGLGVLDLISVVVTADDVVDGKPDPAGFLLACSLLDVEPARCWALEDSVAGVQAAVAAGVRHVIGITTSRTSAQLMDAEASETHPHLAPLTNSVR